MGNHKENEMLNDRPSLPSPKEWAKVCAETCVRQGRTIKSVIGSTGADTPEALRHENRIVAEMRRLGAKEE